LLLSSNHITSVVQEAVVPLFEPLQDQNQGPKPDTDDGIPLLQSSLVGILVLGFQLSAPQVPFTGSQLQTS
jgi:hypothetical protein